MGIHFIDYYTFSHFFFGFICKLVIFPNVPLYSFIVSNGVHLLVELNENTFYKSKRLESFNNHIGDIIAFFIGWYLCYYFNYSLSNKKYNICIKYILLCIIIIALFSEVFREIFPYHNGFIFGICKGAFTK